MYKSRNKIVSKFVEKLLTCRIMFRDILTFLGLDNRDASLITRTIMPIGSAAI